MLSPGQRGGRAGKEGCLRLFNIEGKSSLQRPLLVKLPLCLLVTQSETFPADPLERELIDKMPVTTHPPHSHLKGDRPSFCDLNAFLTYM